MKDIVISGRRLARELRIFLICFAAALCVNVYSILRFKTEWKELVTTLPITLALAVVIFLAVAAVRGIVFGCRKLLGRRSAGV